VEPPTTSGHPIAGPGQIGLGVATLRQLSKRVGDTVTVGSGRARRTLTIVGTVTLPSIGLTIADHVSLGRGAMLADSTLLAAQGLGAVPVTVVPVPALLAGFGVLLAAGNLLAAGPGAVAARTPPAALLRAE
jgi:hypothetical protein